MWGLIITVAVLALIAVGILWACCVAASRADDEIERLLLSRALRDKPAVWHTVTAEEAREAIKQATADMWEAEAVKRMEDTQAAEDEQAYQRMVGEGLGMGV